MERFIIHSNEYLYQNIIGFFHSDYHGGGNWKTDGTIENIITTLKNDITPHPKNTLLIAANRLAKILDEDFSKLSNIIKLRPLTVCVISRAKNENSYTDNQKLFRKVISIIIDRTDVFENGTEYILRHTNTRTTHRNRWGHGGDGDMPYPGITLKTCNISSNVRGKAILLIDDLYTKSINIDEDAIQALLDSGAKTVYFYSIGKTISHNYSNNQHHSTVSNFLKVDVPNTVQETFNLIQAGESVENIAKLRGFTIDTIIKHITELSKVTYLNKYDNIKPPKEILIKVSYAVKIIQETDRLKLIYEYLDGKIGYDQIRLALPFIN